MTEQEALALTRWELDQLVAEKVMGWDHTYDTDWDNPLNGGACLMVDVPRHRYFMPSTDIAAAWEVLDHLRESRGIVMDLTTSCFPDHTPRPTKVFFYSPDYEEWWTVQESAPLAICIAALKAVGVVTDG